MLQIETVKKQRNIWVENADRLVAGFLEMFEEGCHKMVSTINPTRQKKKKKKGERVIDSMDWRISCTHTHGMEIGRAMVLRKCSLWLKYLSIVASVLPRMCPKGI